RRRAAGRLGNHRLSGRVGSTMGERDHAARGRGASAPDDPQRLKALAVLVYRRVEPRGHPPPALPRAWPKARRAPAVARGGGRWLCCGFKGALRAVTARCASAITVDIAACRLI